MQTYILSQQQDVVYKIIFVLSRFLDIIFVRIRCCLTRIMFFIGILHYIFSLKYNHFLLSEGLVFSLNDSM